MRTASVTMAATSGMKILDQSSRAGVTLSHSPTRAPMDAFTTARACLRTRLAMAITTCSSSLRFSGPHRQQHQSCPSTRPSSPSQAIRWVARHRFSPRRTPPRLRGLGSKLPYSIMHTRTHTPLLSSPSWPSLVPQTIRHHRTWRKISLTLRVHALCADWSTKWARITMSPRRITTSSSPPSRSPGSSCTSTKRLSHLAGTGRSSCTAIARHRYAVAAMARWRSAPFCPLRELQLRAPYRIFVRDGWSGPLRCAGGTRKTAVL
mmetsp:Transcript_23344/g.59517  ORF Transcript_23344/g.59517 Transcript_23344/m.59517 type:complete len:263 (+) Transcript_23344:185-973(+)